MAKYCVPDYGVTTRLSKAEALAAYQEGRLVFNAENGKLVKFTFAAYDLIPKTVYANMVDSFEEREEDCDGEL